MNKQEYAEYEQAVAAFFETEGIIELTIDTECEEPYFSGQDCDCCGTLLGGDRYDCSGYNPSENVPSNRVYDGYVICVDCVYYAEYGQLDDMTMMEVQGG